MLLDTRPSLAQLDRDATAEAAKNGNKRKAPQLNMGSLKQLLDYMRLSESSAVIKVSVWLGMCVLLFLFCFVFTFFDIVLFGLLPAV